MNRREAVGRLAALPLVAMSPWTSTQLERVRRAMRLAGAAGETYQPRFFTPPEWETVRLLADLIIPRDERSGAATDAGVPEFMDFMMLDRPDEQAWMRSGLAWLDAQSRRWFGRRVVECTDRQRESLLDAIAWPARASPELSEGVEFFNRFRDLTASGFWSSRMGVADLEYRGNTAVAEWTGCPPEVLDRLGLSYQDDR